MLFFCIHYLDVVARVGMGFKKKQQQKTERPAINNKSLDEQAIQSTG